MQRGITALQNFPSWITVPRSALATASGSARQLCTPRTVDEVRMEELRVQSRLRARSPGITGWAGGMAAPDSAATMTNGQMNSAGGSVHTGPRHAETECGTRGEGTDEEMQWRAVLEYDGTLLAGFQKQGKVENQLLRGSNGLDPIPLQSYDFRNRAMRSPPWRQPRGK